MQFDIWCQMKQSSTCLCSGQRAKKDGLIDSNQSDGPLQSKKARPEGHLLNCLPWAKMATVSEGRRHSRLHADSHKMYHALCTARICTCLYDVLQHRRPAPRKRADKSDSSSKLNASFPGFLCSESKMRQRRANRMCHIISYYYVH